MKRKYILLAVPFLLVSCNKGGSKKEENSVDLEGIFEKYQENFKVEGTIKEIEEDIEEPAATTTFTTKFTDHSYYYSFKLNDVSQELNYFKLTENDTDYLAAYAINTDNEAVLQKVEGDDGYLSWSYVSNPFLDSTSSFSYFSKEDDSTFYLDFEKDNGTAGERYLCARNFISKIAVLNISSYESFKVTIKDNALYSMNIVTKTLVDNYNISYHYEIEFLFSNDESEDYEANKLEPYEHLSYHDTIKSAFNYLFNNPYSFTRKTSGIASTNMPTLNGYIDSETYFIFTPDDNYSGLFKVGDYFHEIVRKDSTYYYEELEATNSGEKITSISSFVPFRSVPIELFILDESSSKYVLSDADNASYFSYYFDIFGDLDTGSSYTYNQAAVSEVDLTLDESSHISKLEFINGSEVVTYTFSYDTSNLLFDKTTLTSYDSGSDIYGTYKVTFAEGPSYLLNKEAVIVIERKDNSADKYATSKYSYNVTLSYDGSTYTCLDVSLYNGAIIFSFDDVTYYFYEESGVYKLVGYADNGSTYNNVATKVEE